MAAGCDVDHTGRHPAVRKHHLRRRASDQPEIIIAGIGSSIPFRNVSHQLYDTIHWVGFDAGLAGSVDLLRRHAVFAGLSTGAGYLAARWERDRGRGSARWCSSRRTRGTGFVDSVSPGTKTRGASTNSLLATCTAWNT